MEDLNIDKLRGSIINALDLYDKNNLKYIQYINSDIKITPYESHNIATFFNNDDEIFKAKCQVFGYYDILNTIWFWGWLLPLPNNETILARELLNYGLKLDISDSNAEQLFYKGILLNSRYIINNKIGLEINLAFFSSLLKDKILFIYPRKIENMIIFYFIIE